ncbi:cytochrome C [Pseudomonas sp. HMWF032]|uniref:c-type cytochrome n=1 Tax=Pseudomonas sp. HMWF032 TaxID=2056866 RepID=UPI000D366EC1|nr:cytochrome c [Pseudomonas sp. HMWF032]PTS85144.1 cytochrome C [Pseudomonas sp. HMWF032]PTT84912.1 cytochrome C [Pseudomonas sp. HMWF010]
MSNKRSLIGLFMALTLIGSVPALADVDGQALYRQHCAKCHAEDGRANTMRGWLYFAQNLSKAKWQDNNSDRDILDAIQEGPGAMPGYADTLSEAEQLALVKAVRDLRKP